jgi:type VI secretion system secreted protein VgrG
VQFHWDRLGNKDENSSCWVRVAQVWAGKRWGASFWPRIGQEVIVAFLEGDPDQPIIVGSIYNADQMPPYLGEGPDGKHRHDPKLSGVKTCSTPGGNGFNEIRFDDTKGKEQLFLRAENTMDVHVNGSQQVSVGGDRGLTVGGSCLQRVEQDKCTDVLGSCIVTAESTHELTAGTELLMGAPNINAHAKLVISLKADQAVFVRGDGGIGLVSGGSFINITPTGIWINAPEVHINSGSEAMQTPKYQYLARVPPASADDAVSGFPSAPGVAIAPPRPKPGPAAGSA